MWEMSLQVPLVGESKQVVEQAKALVVKEVRGVVPRHNQRRGP